MPSTPFAHMLGAGRTEHPPSLSIHKKAPLPGLLLPGLCATCHMCTLPHPLLKCGGRDRRDSVHPPFHLPLCQSYATPIPWVMMHLAFVEFVGPQQPNGEMAQWGNMAQMGNSPKGKVWVHTRK